MAVSIFVWGSRRKKDLKLSPSYSDSQLDRMDVANFWVIKCGSLNTNQRLKSVMKISNWDESLFNEEICLGQFEDSSVRERRNDDRPLEPFAKGNSRGVSIVEFRQFVVTGTRSCQGQTLNSSYLKGEWDP